MAAAACAKRGHHDHALHEPEHSKPESASLAGPWLQAQGLAEASTWMLDDSSLREVAVALLAAMPPVLLLGLAGLPAGGGEARNFVAWALAIADSDRSSLAHRLTSEAQVQAHHLA